ncbi:MAG: aldose epimerase [Microbacteriaceae bacterium]|jgi:aldose 1-epimerase|nr:aldose epimerase [Microbacteriaceae bacterium]
MLNPTGIQYELVRGTARAVITQVGAAIRELQVDGVDLVQPYPATTIAPFGAGITLAPWPNRVRDGLWHHDGEPQQLDLTEPELGNALHGLLRDRPYDLIERTDSSVTLAATIFPTRGYLFEVATTVRFELTGDGITVSHSLRTIGDAAAPVAVGSHPYLRVGDVPIDDLIVTVPAGSHFETDARLNPTAETPVDGTRFDLRGGVPLRGLALDDGFGQLPAGVATSRVSAPDGRAVELWQGDDYRYVQVFVTRIFPLDGEVISALAIEPMSAPADALNSGQGLRWLEPGESWELSWGIRYTAPVK